MQVLERSGLLSWTKVSARDMIGQPCFCDFYSLCRGSRYSSIFGGARPCINVGHCVVSSTIPSTTHLQRMPCILDHLADDFGRWVKWSTYSTWGSVAGFSGNQISS